ncbi:MAG: PilZ domain-containing protein [Candidatus Electrothrix sp. GW3-4]|uniref:PilZ domain-containing protein n=1 Tax=Candidatus Electrothrix sp. GW3-4 TaxID=3126740 RepID=UPI0030D0106C
MTACKEQVYAFEKSLQLIEKFVQNGSLNVSEKSFLALYNTYEKLMDMAPDSDELRANKFILRPDNDYLTSSKNMTLSDAACENTEQRLHPRAELEGYTADIIQGGLAYTAYVQDVSREGIQLNDLPTEFSSIQEEKFTVIISSLFDSMHYKLIAHSKWRKVRDGSLAVGFQLVDIPVTWNLLINKIILERNL